MPSNRLQPFFEAGERLLALVLLVTLLPLLALLALLIKLTSPGPVIFRQIRVGLQGRLFTLYKLRTMYHNCERMSGPRWASPDDPRITPLGRFLRASHLDEIPQLMNVIRGDMALVGPRPERPEFVTVLAELLPNYTSRLRVKPGITGLAQIQLPPDTDLASVQKKLVCDLYYVQQRNPGLDIRILIATILHLFKVPSRHLLRLLRLPAWYALCGDIGVMPVALPSHPACSTSKLSTRVLAVNSTSSSTIDNVSLTVGSPYHKNGALDHEGNNAHGAVSGH